ncbi:MAG TPA: type II toxin-antitoxin system RelE/ParE family toxin [Planctomycetaceae bacterium]|nr:type II toxin-antitoxin system RelE/ParE family toxin [Planctomycetaceae bacterium]
MTYKLSMLRRAQKALAQFPQGDYERVRDAVASLASDPRPKGCKKLIGREGWRIREGDYRIIYEVNDVDHQVTVLDIGHRRDVYH